MINPILQMLNSRSNINNVLNLLSSNDPNKVFNQLIRSNPQFASFVDANKGKSIEQIASENNIDLNMIRQFLR